MNVKHANKSQLTTLLSLIKNFFIYLYLLPRPHRRRMFMAGLVQKYTSQGVFKWPFTAVFLSIMGLASSVLFISHSMSLPTSLHIALFLLLFLFPITYVCCFLRAKPFLLRYSHYAQTPQFQDKTKRRQTLILDVTKKWGHGHASLIDTFIMIEVLFVLLWIASTILIAPSSMLDSLWSNRFFLNGIEVAVFLVPFAFPFAADMFISQTSRKFLYHLYLGKHRSMPQEIEDIVNAAWEIYPENPKHK